MLSNVRIKLIRESDEASMEFGAYSDWMFIKDSLDGFSSVDNQVSLQDYAVRDGSYITNARVSSKIRTFEAAYTKPTNNESERRELVSFLSVKDTYKMYFTYGERIVWQSCMIYKMKLSISARIRRTLHLTLSMIFEDPYWNSYDDFGQNIAAQDPMIGFPYLSASSHDYGTDAMGVQQYGPIGITGTRFRFAPIIEVDNDGEAPTYCRAVISASGTLVNPKIIVNDEYIRIIDVLYAGDSIEVDMIQSPPRVTKNGANWIGHCDKTSSFTGMVLNVGTNEVGFDADDGEANMAVYIYYNKKYEAI